MPNYYYTIFNYLLILTFIITAILPWLIKRHKFVVLFVFYIVSTATLSIAMYKGAEISNNQDEKRIVELGYNWHSDNPYANVSEENRKEVEQLERSLMGLGWPMKGILSAMFFDFCLTIVLGISAIINWLYIRYIRRHTKSLPSTGQSADV